MYRLKIVDHIILLLGVFVMMAPVVVAFRWPRRERRLRTAAVALSSLRAASCCSSVSTWLDARGGVSANRILRVSARS